MITEPIVSVVMITYNHKIYIQEAIEGVLMQKSDYAIELIIADDCSPDNTFAIVKEIIDTHPRGHLIKYTKHKTNLGMMSNFIWSLEQCKGKYIALCEGDDYCTDPLKLQKQVDFLEENEEYAGVASNSYFLFEETKEQKLFNTATENRTLILEELLEIAFQLY